MNSFESKVKKVVDPYFEEIKSNLAAVSKSV